MRPGLGPSGSTDRSGPPRTGFKAVNFDRRKRRISPSPIEEHERAASCVSQKRWHHRVTVQHQKFVRAAVKMAYDINELKKIGLGLVGFGILFSFLGVILFFDRGLLALGNLFCLTGIAFLLGWRSTWKLFTCRTNYKGSFSFLMGLFLILIRWPIFGILFEIYGCIVLFGGFWPSIKAFLFHIPVVGWIIQYPVLLLHRLGRRSV